MLRHTFARTKQDPSVTQLVYKKREILKENLVRSFAKSSPQKGLEPGSDYLLCNLSNILCSVLRQKTSLSLDY